MYSERDISRNEDSEKQLIDSLKRLSVQDALLALIPEWRGLPSPLFHESAKILDSLLTALLAGKDVLFQDRFSTMTMRFLPVLLCAMQLIDENINETQVLILMPTRDYCQEVLSLIPKITKETKIETYGVFVGTNILEQRKRLQEKPQIIIGTPGRVRDMAKREFLKVGVLKLIILGEADEMLSRGLEDPIKEILKLVPMDVQMGFVSSYFSAESQSLEKFCLREPVSMVMKPEEFNLRDTEHVKVLVKEEKEKMEFLSKLFSSCIGSRPSVISCQSRKKMMEVAEALKEKGLNVAGISGNMVSMERCQTVEEFWKGSYQILVTGGFYLTWAGIFSLAPLMIHYDLPLSKEWYIGGRREDSPWRPPKKKTAISFVMPEDFGIVEEIESYYSIKLKELSAEDMLEKLTC